MTSDEGGDSAGKCSRHSSFVFRPARLSALLLLCCCRRRFALGFFHISGLAEALATGSGHFAHGRPGRLVVDREEAIGAVEGDHMGLFDVLVMPEARRQGLARRVTESLYAWAWQRGARFAYLQVVAANAAALPLYEAQGFRTIYDYSYWLPPA